MGLRFKLTLFTTRGRQFQCQRIFQVPAPVNAVILHPDQTQIMVGDQSGIIHMWDLRNDQNEQLVSLYLIFETITNNIFI